MFNVGDKARIIPRDQIIDPESEKYGWNPEMDQFCGRVVTIRDVNWDHYYIEEDKHLRSESGFMWLHKYFEPVITTNIETDELLHLL